jgi:hypothetical protein
MRQYLNQICELFEKEGADQVRYICRDGLIRIIKFSYPKDLTVTTEIAHCKVSGFLTHTYVGERPITRHANRYELGAPITETIHQAVSDFCQAKQRGDKEVIPF